MSPSRSAAPLQGATDGLSYLPREGAMTMDRVSQSDTIFALASGTGAAGVAVIRVSGPQADNALASLSRQSLPARRKAVIRTLFEIMNGQTIDSVLAVRFPGPASYTGEDIVEIQCHGGRAVIASVLGALAGIPGLRPAEAGEFTRRAVENGRLDLTRAEAIADLVAAETDAQRRQAQRQMSGHLADLYENWRTRVIIAAAWIEASIDFADEEIPEETLERSREGLRGLLLEIRKHLNDGRRGELLRDGFHVAIIGPPNAGKSALVNALAQRDVAIVSPEAGTTRDIIEIRLDLKGYPVVLADTAGIRETGHLIEREGVRRAKVRAEEADFRLLVLDGSTPSPFAGLDGDIQEKADLIVWNKADLGGFPPHGALPVSALTGSGLDALLEKLSQAAASRMASEAPALTRLRHRIALEEAALSLESAISATETELAAEQVRRALHALGRITGRVDLDELLDVVFRDFCIGK